MNDIIIDRELTLIPYFPNEDVALKWYQDKDVCRQVDNLDRPYSAERLRAMYSFLSTHGECWYIDYRGTLVGDVALRDNAEIAIVVCKEYQNRGIGRRCIAAMLARAKEKGMHKVSANIYAFNTQSRQTFLHAGFVQVDEEWFECAIMKEAEDACL